MKTKRPHLMVLGPGFTAKPIMQQLKNDNWQVSASFRRLEAREDLIDAGYRAFDIMSDSAADIDLETVTHILTSISPGKVGDTGFKYITKHSAQLSSLEWAGYLSSTNVYGDHQGRWVDEATPTNPSLERGIKRVDAEKEWQAFANKKDIPLHIFRLAGIYGPGRNAVRSLLCGKARRVIKEGQVFSRIHVSDICEAVTRAANSDLPSEIFNLADDMPAPPQTVIEFAADLLGIDPPPAQDWETADMSPMARSFYMESKKVKNDKIKRLLRMELTYPDYITGLKELLEGEKAD
jgi:nucleoside-diphosphate-sugar epimerase